MYMKWNRMILISIVKELQGTPLDTLIREFYLTHKDKIPTTTKNPLTMLEF